jgi:hypothetical protein
MQSFVMATLLSVLVATQQVTVPPAEVAHQVKKHLMSLTYYGPFDLITFNVDENDVVTLGGYVVYDIVKSDAEREAREVKGVKEVQNKIEVAELLPLDDAVRHQVFHAIYGDPALGRYGTPGSELWSMRPGFRGWGSGEMRGPRMLEAPFYGLEPIGDYAIHILVKNRVVTLVGVVDNEGDRRLAALKAHGVSLVTAVNNSLEVAGKSAETK